METTIIPVSGVPQFNTPLIIKTAPTDPAPIATIPVPQVEFPVPVTETAAPEPSTNITQQEEEAARQAALSFKNFYAISDTASSTYKDVTGTLITRSVNLRDGTVTYSPQPQYVRPLQNVSIDA